MALASHPPCVLNVYFLRKGMTTSFLPAAYPGKYYVLFIMLGWDYIICIAFYPSIWPFTESNNYALEMLLRVVQAVSHSSPVCLSFHCFFWGRKAFCSQ
jgi:hypothetical protein